MSFFSTQEKAFGLDISDKKLRLIQLSARGKKVGIQLYNEIELPAGCLIDGAISQEKVFLEYLNRLIKTRHGRGSLANEVIISLPETKTFLKTITLGNCHDNNDLKIKLAEALPQHLPLNLEEIYYDYQIISQDNQQTTLLIGATPKQLADNYFQVLEQTNLLPVAFEVEAAAIARLLIEHNGDNEPQIIIDIGANRTGLFLYDDSIIKFTISLPTSGNQITRLISETLDLDLTQAEKAKIVCGLDEQKCHGALKEILSNNIQELNQEIIKAIGFYYDNFPNHQQIKKITLCGGGANLENIDSVIGSATKIPTVISQPKKNLYRCPAFFTSANIQSYITAIGLALRGLLR